MMDTLGNTRARGLASACPGRHPLFALGFRPLYLLAATFAPLAALLWCALYLGWLPAARAPATMPALFWHAHEMVFGFASAVVTGFLFTAGKNWTGLQTPHGRQLAALAGLWLAARVLLWTGPAPLAAVVDSAFLPLCGLLFLRVLLRAHNRRNVGLAGALLLLGTLNMGFHWACATGHFGLALQLAEAGTGLLVLFVAIIGGRVIPMFTANAIPGLAIQRRAWVERAVLPLTLAAIATLGLGLRGPVAATLFGAAALLHGWRLAGWGTARTLTRPLVFILHLAYGFLVAGMALLALAALGWLDRSTALHALTTGAIACAIIGMITRTALGHTGRPLLAGRAETLAYACIAAAALIRVGGPTLLPQWKAVWIATATALWVIAFIAYLWRYAPMLSTARADGKEG